MIAAWCLNILTRRERSLPDVLVIGTDPVLSIVVAAVVKRLRPNVRIVHWCYDLYPEAPIAEGMLSENSLAMRVLKRLLKSAYRSCDLLADLGCCMRRRLDVYRPTGRQFTFVPWALAEPSEPVAMDAEVRRTLFGDAPLGLLYSGNFGRAHSYHEFLDLARRLRHDGVHFCFGVRGNQANELRCAVRAEDANISFAPFAPESALEARLGAADIHLVSLRPNWTGLVVPSKFFGSLAVGRPVMFAGARDSSIGQWIARHQVGWVLDNESTPIVAQELRRLAASPGQLQSLRHRCYEVYHRHFSLAQTMDRWDEELHELVHTARKPRGG
jgi:glycosyltransferase involved in cell wall biosynthesis